MADKEINPSLNIELFEKPLLEQLQNSPTIADTTNYKITRVGPGVYSIIIKIDGIGDQEFKLTFSNGQFRLSGYLAIIGPNASFPLSYVADIVNGFVANWIQKLVDSNVTKVSKE